MRPSDATPLAGIGVLVTRPAAQSDGLARAIERRGGSALRFPVLEIAPPRDVAVAVKGLSRLSSYDWAIFVSVNAVERSVELSAHVMHDLDSSGLKIAAVGSATAAALRKHGATVTLQPPQGATGAEFLLQALEFERSAVSGFRVVIVKGEGGRTLLMRELTGRGALVEQLSVYRRTKPTHELRATFPNFERDVDIIVLTSGDAMQNLFDMAGPDALAWLRARRMVVPSERLASLAIEFGVTRTPVVASAACDEALADAVVRGSHSHGAGGR